MDSKPMRALGERAAKRCEHAKTPANKCRCRCGGKFHGTGGQRAGGVVSDVFDLPSDDPHNPGTERQKGHHCGCSQTEGPCEPHRIIHGAEFSEGMTIEALVAAVKRHG